MKTFKPSLPRPEPMAPFRYLDLTVPPQYHCGQCGTHGVKLWRDYNTFLESQSLLCGTCACKEQSNASRRYTVTQDTAGCVDARKDPDPHHTSGGDQIGWRIPAVPTEDGTTFWGYTSVPAAGVAWWKRLPLATHP